MLSLYQNTKEPEHPLAGERGSLGQGVPRLQGRREVQPNRGPGGDREERFQLEHRPLRGHRRRGGTDRRGGRVEETQRPATTTG